MNELKKAHRILALETTKAYQTYKCSLRIKNNDENHPEVIYQKALWIGMRACKRRINELLNDCCVPKGN